MRILLRHSLLIALLLLSPAIADARGGHLFGRTSQYQTTTTYYYPVYYAPATLPVTVSYYVPTPVAVAPAVVAPVEVCPQPVVVAPAVPVVAPPLAQPQPAPPSRTAEPPISPPKVKASSEAFYQTYTAKRPDLTGGATKQVGFWNTTQRTVTLRVNGDSYLLAPGHALTLRLPAQFTWQYDQGPTHSETVPAGRATFEVVIRQ